MPTGGLRDLGVATPGRSRDWCDKRERASRTDLGLMKMTRAKLC